MVGFKEAIQMLYSNFANFEGRARRSEYWFVQLYMFLICLVLVLLLALLGDFNPSTAEL